MSRIKFVGFDVDFTKINFARNAGITAAAWIMRDVMPEQGLREIVDKLDDHSKKLLGQYGIETKRQHVAVMDSIFGEHVHIVGCEDFTERMWNFYVKCIHTAMDHGLKPSQALRRLCVKAEHEFWRGVGENSRFYPDALETLMKLDGMGVEMFFMTSSDARVACVDGYALPVYNPDVSRRLKHERLRRSGFYNGHASITPDRVFVSDPFGKEDIRAWNSIVFPALPVLRTVPWVFVGDSLQDMEAGYAAGAVARILVDRHVGAARSPHMTHLVQELAVIPDIIASL